MYHDATQSLKSRSSRRSSDDSDSPSAWREVAAAVAEIDAGRSAPREDVAMDDSPSGSQRPRSKSSLWFILDDEDESPEEKHALPPSRESPDEANIYSREVAPPTIPAASKRATKPANEATQVEDAKAAAEMEEETEETEDEAYAAPKRRKTTRRSSATPVVLVAVSTEVVAAPKRAERKRKARRRPPSRICKFEGCEQYVVDQGLCVRHGGGKRCEAEGCTSRAKHHGKCWKHGGSTGCKVAGCPNRAKSRGYCWSHGGGTKCKTGGCEKIAISNGLCWAHGGGKRCIIEGCKRQAYERTQNYCNTHYTELLAGSSEGVDEEADDDNGTPEEEDGEGEPDPEEEEKHASTPKRKRITAR